MVRVRFAPSPTGNLHIGGVRTALFNYLFARSHKGAFLLRIEDTDLERSKTAYTEHILESLKWLDITIDEPVVFQSCRQSLYEHYFVILKKKGVVYPCFCTVDDLQQEREEARKQGVPYCYSGRCRELPSVEVEQKLQACQSHTYRFFNEKNGTVKWQDRVHGIISFDTSRLDDFIIRRSDGSFTYNYCVVIDDLDMEITHVIRGDDHISNTPRQILLFQSLSEEPPAYAHVPMILGPDRKRLSKRHGACGLLNFKKEGYLKEALVNFCALMGWSWDDKTTIFSRQELIDTFTLDKISSSPAVFDKDKLNWLNRYYLRSLSLSQIMQALAPFLREEQQMEKISHDILLELVKISRERVTTLKELAETIGKICRGPSCYEEKAVRKCRKKFLRPGLLPGLIAFLNNLKEWSLPSFEEKLREWAQQNDYKFVAVAQVLRLALTGSLVSPPIIECAVFLGRDTVLSRLSHLEQYLRSSGDYEG